MSIPSDLQSVIGTEKMDFAVIAKRKQPLKRSLGIIAFGLFWTAFTSIFVIVFFGPLMRGEEVHFTSNGVETTGSWDNFQPMLVPSLIIGLFVLVGLGMLFWGFYTMFQKGGYYVGTSNRLIHYYKGEIKSYDWELFSGGMEINNRKGYLAFQLRTGNMVSSDRGSNHYVPDIIYISGVNNILELERICSKRIKENDLTLPTTT